MTDERLQQAAPHSLSSVALCDSEREFRRVGIDESIRVNVCSPQPGPGGADRPPAALGDHSKVAHSTPVGKQLPELRIASKFEECRPRRLLVLEEGFEEHGLEKADVFRSSQPNERGHL